MATEPLELTNVVTAALGDALSASDGAVDGSDARARSMASPPAPMFPPSTIGPGPDPYQESVHRTVPTTSPLGGPELDALRFLPAAAPSPSMSSPFAASWPRGAPTRSSPGSSEHDAMSLLAALAPSTSSTPPHGASVPRNASSTSSRGRPELDAASTSPPMPDLRPPRLPAGALPNAPGGSSYAGMGAPHLDVVGLLAGASPALAAAPSSLPSGVPPWLVGGDMADAAQLSRLPSTGADAMYGDQLAIETLGRGFSRRDPASGFDVLPQGRDSVTFSTAAVSSKQDAGQHSPELIGFRASERFPRDDQHANEEHLDGVPPSVPHVPTWASRRVSDAPATALWPQPPPTARAKTHSKAFVVDPVRRDPQAASAPHAQVDTPPWLRAPALPPALPPAQARSARAPDAVASTSPFARVQTPRPATSRVPSAARGLGLDGVRDDFPIFKQRIHGHPLIWLDNGATTQKPQAVIDAESRFYENDNSNVHRGAHTLAARATDAYEGAREKVQRYLGASSKDEIVFVRGATEAINLVAQAWGRDNVNAGDDILVTHLEHHANIVPWQRLAHERGAQLRVIPVDDNGDVRLDIYESMLSPRTKMVAITQVSNALGTVVPVGPMAALARQHGARILVDGAQSVAHLPLDVKCLGADFFVFSGHKVYAPTGIGALWGRKDVLESMSPWQSGGGMIRDVTFERTIYAPPPAKFEAGTPNLAGAVGLGAALDYVESLGRPQIAAWEHMLLEQMVAGLRTVRGLRIIGAPMVRAGAVSFVMDDHTPEEVAKHLDRRGIAVRAGHHCAQPILRRFGLEQTVRPSVGVYNVPDDIERLTTALHELAAQTTS